MIKDYEKFDSSQIRQEDSLYSINQVIELYPILSKHIITNAINNNDLKVTWIGNKRYFNLKDIDDYLLNHQEKINNNVSNLIETWRN